MAASTTADGVPQTENQGMGTMTKVGLAGAAVAGYLLFTGKGGSFLDGLKDALDGDFGKNHSGLIGTADKVAGLAQTVTHVGAYLGMDPKKLLMADGAEAITSVLKDGISRDNVGQLLGATERWATTKYLEESMGVPAPLAALIGDAVKATLGSLNRSIGGGALNLLKNANIGKLLNPSSQNTEPTAPSPVSPTVTAGGGHARTTA